MFLSWEVSSWALAMAIWSQVNTNSGKVGLWFLVVAGIGEAMASFFDVTHDTRNHNPTLPELVLTCDQIAIANAQERSEEHTSELQSRLHLVCRLLLEKKKQHF